MIESSHIGRITPDDKKRKQYSAIIDYAMLGKLHHIHQKFA